MPNRPAQSAPPAKLALLCSEARAIEILGTIIGRAAAAEWRAMQAGEVQTIHARIISHTN